MLNISIHIFCYLDFTTIAKKPLIYDMQCKKNRIIYNKKNTLIDLKNCTFFQFEEMLLIIQTCILPDYRMRKNTIMKRIDNKIRKQ